jgi:hypothetical protein
LAEVTVSPETFTMVDYDAAEIRGLAERLADQVGLPAGLAVELRVDETVPLGKVRITSTDPVVIELDGGALEDPKRIRQYYPLGATRVIGRLLFQTSDLLDPAFGSPPGRDDQTLEQRVAWDTYGAGRVAGLGHDAQRQRWLYAFRTRHGFNDSVDRAFESLWSGRGLSWADVDAISTEASAADAA